MTFIRYPHLSRYGQPDVEGIDVGYCHIFPKLDGTNASIWWDNELKCGSRNRIVTPDDDNHNFATAMYKNEHIAKLAEEFPNYVFFGEWLVPHSLKTYRDDAWRKFYIFDIFSRNDEVFIHYEVYKFLKLQHPELNFIDPLAIIRNPTESDLHRVLQSNTYLIQDGAGPGEGIVIKRYGYTNKFGRTTWAKLVTNEFKEKNTEAFGVIERDGKRQVEAEFAEKYVTKHLVDKTRAKIGDIERQHLIPRLLETVRHDVINEEMYNAVKQWKNPTIDFKVLTKFITEKTKHHAKDLFL